MAKNNVVFNLSLEQYNKKYHNRKFRLVKYTKKEVEDFDIKYQSEIKNRLLSNRKWAFIKDTYYEIPKAPRLTWFRNLHVACQASICAVGGIAVASAITFPTLAVTVWNKQNDWVELKGMDAAKEFIKNYYSNKTVKPLKSVDVECDYRGSNNDPSTKTAINLIMNNMFGNDYVSDSLYYKGTRDENSTGGNYFNKCKASCNKIINETFLNEMETVYGQNLTFLKKENEMIIKGNVVIPAEGIIPKSTIKQEIYINSNGQTKGQSLDSEIENQAPVGLLKEKTKDNFNY